LPHPGPSLCRFWLSTASSLAQVFSSRIANHLYTDLEEVFDVPRIPKQAFSMFLNFVRIILTKYELRDPLIKGLNVHWLKYWKHPVASIIMSETMMLGK
jgi:hypothetical protein